jgi:hypothetical protein
MNRSLLAIAASTALIISGPAYAQRGHGGGKPTTSPSTTHGPSTQHGNSGATTHGNSGATTHGNSGATTHGKSGATTHGNSGTHGPSTTSGSTATHGKSGETHGGSAKHSDTSSTTSTAKSSTTTASGTSTTTLTPVQQKLQKNTNLASKLQSRLPEGTDLMKASEGFKNLGQFVAAVNVSNNLKIDFTELKGYMVDDGMSLGQAIQKSKTTADVQTEVTRAETEADTMIKSSTTTTTSPTTSTSSKKTKKSTSDK